MNGLANLGLGNGGGSNCICSLPTLIILILIILQFSKKRNTDCDDDDNEGGRDLGFGNNQIGNGVLFIIALFFLSCAGCGKGNCGGGYGA